MPDAPGLELIAAELDRTHPGAVLDTTYDFEQAALVIDPAAVRGVLVWLRDTPGQGYDFMSSLHAADYLPAEPRFAVHYEMLNRDRVERIRVKALLHDPAAGADALTGRNGDGNGAGRAGEGSVGATDFDGSPLPEIDSVTDLFPTASFQEREAYDFFGIHFRGHPSLKRILMPDEYIGWPQRRDFPVGGEPVIFTRDEPENPGWWL